MEGGGLIQKKASSKMENAFFYFRQGGIFYTFGKFLRITFNMLKPLAVP